MAAIAGLPNIPAANEPVILPSGAMNPVWYRYFAALDKALRAVS